MALVAVAHRDEHAAVLRRGQLVVDGELRLGVCLRVALRNAHDLARGFHLGPQDDLGAREAAPGHDGLLHAEVVQTAFVARQTQLSDVRTRHDARRAAS